MLLKYFYDAGLAHASYLIGCQKSGEAIVIDPGRDIEPYLAAARQEGLRLVGAAETHIHADFVSGSRELADRVGARLYLSDEGPEDWKYTFADQYSSKLLKDGDTIQVGKVELQVVHTPGHTPESISYLLIDRGGGASTPMGIFTGDFVFVGSIGRPDLLETAAGVVGSAEEGAHALYHSMRRFREFPDHLQVWPAHGAGSACGKGLGAIPSTTIGYEKLYNPALQFDEEQAFVDYILADQPETPFYFAVMKRVNKVGPELLRNLPPVRQMDTADLVSTASEYLVFDPRSAASFAHSHVPGTIHVPASQLVAWAGFFVDYERPVYLLANSEAVDGLLRSLRSIGIDRVAGYFNTEDPALQTLRSEASDLREPKELREGIERGAYRLLDVRSATEFAAGHIPQAEHLFLGHLPRKLAGLDREKPVVVQCQGGTRSAIASSLLRRAGVPVVDLRGGYQAWVRAGLPTSDPAFAPAVMV